MQIYFVLMIVRKIIFPIPKKMKKLCCVICARYEKFEKPKISHLLEKTFFLLFAVSARMKMKKYS